MSAGSDDVLALTVAERVGLAETAEAAFMHDFEAGAPPEAQAALGMHQRRLAGGVVLTMAADPTGGYWNKALGFGVSEPFTQDVAREVLDTYRAHGCGTAVLQVAPSALPEDWEDVCGRLGLVAAGTWVKLLRPTAMPAPPAATDLRVGRVGPEDAAAWARAFAIGFGMPEHPSMLAFFAAAADPGSAFEPWGAWDGDRLVAGANLHVAGPAAAFCGAATLPDARGRGAQSAFMAHRVDAARDLGARWCSAETWREDPSNENPALHHNPSLHNMRRAGFVDAYDRTNWLWRA